MSESEKRADEAWDGPVTDEYLQFVAEGEIGKRKSMAQELLAIRRASQAAPAPQDADRAMLIKELSDAARWRRLPDNENQLATAVLFERAVAALSAAPAPSDGLREALERIAEQQMYRSGYDQTDISVEPVLTASEMQEIARVALTASPAALAVPPLTADDQEKLTQLARREAGGLQFVDYHVHPDVAGLKAEADRIARNLAANPIPQRGALTRCIIDLLRKVFP